MLSIDLLRSYYNFLLIFVEPTMVLKVASILLLISVVCGRPEYRNLIPNGPSVPNPCGSTVIWDAVGHFQPLKHTHLKNSFGNVSSSIHL